MIQSNSRRIFASALVASALLSVALRAGTVQFTIDESKSELTLAGDIWGAPIVEQGPGSLKTTVSGFIVASESTSGIQFLGHSYILPSINGNWKPGPNGISTAKPAVMAGQFNSVAGLIKGALRDLVLDVTSEILPFGNGQFDASSLTFKIPTDTAAAFDYSGDSGVGRTLLPKTSRNQVVNGASLTLSGGLQKLVINIDAEFTTGVLLEGDTVLHLRGVLVATQADVPAITSLFLKDQTVVVRVHGFGSNASLQGSNDLKRWGIQNAAMSEDKDGTFLTFPLKDSCGFFRFAQ